MRENKAEFLEPSDEIVFKFKWQQPIQEHYSLGAKPWPRKAGKQSPGVLPKLSKIEAAADWREEHKRTIKGLALRGEKSKAVGLYKNLFICSLAEAKNAVNKMVRS